MPPPTKYPEAYLGDGVYATWDGFHIWLDLRGQDSFTRIALEADVFQNLIDFKNTHVPGTVYVHEKET